MKLLNIRQILNENNNYSTSYPYARDRTRSTATEKVFAMLGFEDATATFYNSFDCIKYFSDIIGFNYTLPLSETCDILFDYIQEHPEMFKPIKRDGLEEIINNVQKTYKQISFPPPIKQSKQPTPSEEQFTDRYAVALRNNQMKTQLESQKKIKQDWLRNVFNKKLQLQRFISTHPNANLYEYVNDGDWFCMVVFRADANPLSISTNLY